MGSEAPPVPGRKRTKDWLPTPSPPHTHSPGLPESCCGLAEGRERGRDQGKKGGAERTLEEGQEIKDQGSKEEESARCSCKSIRPQCPPSHLRSELLSRMPPPWDAKPTQKGSGAPGGHAGQAAGDPWARLAQ